MKWFAALVLAVSMPVMVQANGLPRLADVMKGATAIATLHDGSILVAKPEGGYLCVLDVADVYFQALAQGQPEIVRTPAAICTSVDNFKTIGEN